jgi:hypothetical protein
MEEVLMEIEVRLHNNGENCMNRRSALGIFASSVLAIFYNSNILAADLTASGTIGKIRIFQNYSITAQAVFEVTNGPTVKVLRTAISHTTSANRGRTGRIQLSALLAAKISELPLNFVYRETGGRICGMNTDGHIYVYADD